MIVTPGFVITDSTLLQIIEMSMIPKRRRNIIFLRSKTFLNLLSSSSYQIFSFWMICPSFDVSHRTPSSFPSSWPYPFPSWPYPSQDFSSYYNTCETFLDSVFSIGTILTITINCFLEACILLASKEAYTVKFS